MKKGLTIILTILSIITSQAQNITKDENGKFILSDKSGKAITNQKYDAVLRTSHCSCDKDILVVKFDGKWGAIDTNGIEIIPPTYESLSRFEDGIATAKLNGKWGYINNKGEVVIPFKYDMTLNFFQGIAGVSVDNKFGFINLKGETIIPYSYDDVSNFTYIGKGDQREYSNAKYARVFVGKKSYFIDKEGNIIKTRKVEDLSPLKSWIGKESRYKN